MNKKSRHIEVIKRLVHVPFHKQFYKKGSWVILFSVLFQNWYFQKVNWLNNGVGKTNYVWIVTSQLLLYAVFNTTYSIDGMVWSPSCRQ